MAFQGLSRASQHLAWASLGLVWAFQGLALASQGLAWTSQGLDLAFKGLARASLSLAWASLGLAQASGGTDERMNERTNERTEFLPILQDFVPYRGRCPASHSCKLPNT